MFTLIPLPYAVDALEPVIRARTIGFHHGKHLQAYVDNLNKLLPGTPYEALSLEEIVVATAPTAPTAPTASSAPMASSGPTGNATAIFNNAGQILNHNLYFTQFHPATAPDAAPRPALLPLSQLPPRLALPPPPRMTPPFSDRS